MGQIVKRKKKGRPSKADLARRASGQSPADTVPERRRSLRRRNVRYNNFIDYDDYLDEFDESEEIEEEEEEVEERRKEKKLKLVLKLNNQNKTRNKAARGEHAREDAVASSSEEEDENEKKPLKKRKINGGSYDSEAEYESENDHGNHDDNNQEERERRVDTKGHDSAPGTPSDHPNGLPMPDKKSLELILDKLQKKDTYGVYAEPVDLEELPDYLEVIDHPMDFATLRKKLGNGSYSTFEQFESDVFLICSNAMQYNPPETIYHKQARAIHELARKKFQKLRIDYERSEKELKSEQKTKPNLAKKQMRKPLSRTVQEPVGSDFSSGATLATTSDLQNGFIATQASAYDRPSIDGTVEGISSLVDNNLDKAEELSSGKSLLSKFGRKSSMLDENRRATYNITTQLVPRSESVFTTFESEIKQLVAVGLHAECAYARSMARFAATLGPVAWKVASQRIEQALPPGCKFGRGWVGEYEPLPTPVLMLEARTQKESVLFAKLQGPVNVPRDELTSRTPVPTKEAAKENHGRVPTSEPAKENNGRAPTLELAKENHVRAQTSDSAKENHVRAPASELAKEYHGGEPTSELKKENHVRALTSEGKSLLFCPTSGPVLEGRPSLFSSAVSKPGTPIHVNPTIQNQNLPPRNFGESQNKASKQVELNLPPSSYQHDADVIAEKKLSNSEMAASNQKEIPRTMGLLQSMPSKLPENNVVGSGGLPNGKVSSSLNSRMIGSSSDGIHSQMAPAAIFFAPGQEQVLNDPVEAMRISAGRAQKQQKPSNQSSVDTPPAMPSLPPARDDSSNAAVSAARAWMSIGSGGFKLPTESSPAPKNQISAESLYNPTRQLHPQFPRIQGQFTFPPGMQFQADKNSFPFQAFMRPAVAGNEAQFQNRPMIFPQFIAADLSRLQMQSQWRGLSPHSQPKQKQEILPPDLNIGFQSPGSPVKQSSGVMVDSQQPDLALQL